MGPISQTNTPAATAAMPPEGNHTKLGVGELCLLNAYMAFKNDCDEIQASISKLEKYFATQVTETVIPANQTLLDSDQAAITALAADYKANPDKYKDSQGNDLYGADAMAEASIYSTDKKSCQARIDQCTVKTTLMSDSVTSISKNTSTESTQIQTALSSTSSLLDLLATL